jgi:hypothetical protein
MCVDANIVRVSDDGSQLPTGTTPPWISNLQKEFEAQHCLRFRFPGAGPRRHGGRVPVLWEGLWAGDGGAGHDGAIRDRSWWARRRGMNDVTMGFRDGRFLPFPSAISGMSSS